MPDTAGTVTEGTPDVAAGVDDVAAGVVVVTVGVPPVVAPGLVVDGADDVAGAGFVGPCMPLGGVP